jgi:hypothetical protein
MTQLPETLNSSFIIISENFNIGKKRKDLKQAAYAIRPGFLQPAALFAVIPASLERKFDLISLQSHPHASHQTGSFLLFFGFWTHKATRNRMVAHGRWDFKEKLPDPVVKSHFSGNIFSSPTLRGIFSCLQAK